MTPSTPGRNPARSRREARERAIELAYEAEMRSLAVDDLLAGLPVAPDPFVVELLKAAERQQEVAEKLIAERATGWTLERMPAIDRLVMRLAVAELLDLDTPTGVVLSEAVDLASRYSTDESSRFVNGVLAAIARELPSR
ncbi:MAG: transcription antitermination factor NusB [Acidimicrobiia bacterium]|nr:transcription antitermination factor NusB [Acidimicrobiia bacterium]